MLQIGDVEQDVLDERHVVLECKLCIADDVHPVDFVPGISKMRLSLELEGFSGKLRAFVEMTGIKLDYVVVKVFVGRIVVFLRVAVYDQVSRCFLDCSVNQFEHVGVIAVVRIQEKNPWAAGVLYAGIACLRNAEIAIVMDNRDAIIAGSKVFDDCSRTVG